jgi:RNA-directed DNA polymerase
MKRVGNLMEAIADPDNLRLAFWRAARGKAAKAEVRQFRAGLNGELARMGSGLLSGDYPVGRFTQFTVWDPKERRIHAAAFPERVLHHALMNVCEPWFERLLISDTYACRRGMGQWAAVRRAERYAAASRFFLKLDVCKYFDSIVHDRLLAGLERHFKDPLLLHWFRRIVLSHETSPGRGLPIGSLTSQHFANFYLGALDRFVKEGLGRRRYVRYMDDSVVWGASGGELKPVLQALGTFLEVELGLQLKPQLPTSIAPPPAWTSSGVASTRVGRC